MTDMKDTGYSLSKALILATINPKFDNRLFLTFPSSVKENYKFSTYYVIKLYFVNICKMVIECLNVNPL